MGTSSLKMGFPLLLILILCISPLQSAPADSPTAKMIKSSMDSSVNPCNDFYEYACGNWNKQYPVPEGYPMWNYVQEVSTSISPQLEKILDRADVSTDNEAICKTRKIYRACKNAGSAEAVQIEKLNSLINRVGGWPLLMDHQKWIAQGLTWQDVHAKLFKTLYTPALFECSVLADSKDATRNKLTLAQTSLYLRREDLLNAENESVLEGYRTFIQQVAEALQGSNANLDRIKEGIEEIVNFEKSLAEIIIPEFGAENVDEWYHPTTFSNFQTLYNNAALAAGPRPQSNINWLDACRDMFSINPKITIPTSEPLNVMGHEYLTKLPGLLKKTPEKTIVNYMVWRVITDLAPYMPGKIRDGMTDFTNEKRKGVDKMGEIDCVTGSQMPRAVSYAYVKEHLPEEAKQKAEEILDDILEAMKDHIRETDWMDQETRDLAIEKMEAMTKFIGYPDDYSPENMDKFYEDFIAADTYLENELMNSKFLRSKTMDTMGKPVNQKEWPAEPSTGNAFYMATRNAIIVPAGMLQRPYYDANRPSFVNYAMIGTVIGHEVSHSMDSTGRRFDKSGNLVQWWNQDSIDKYEARTQCFIDQFSNYTIFNDGTTIVKLDGKKTLGENISDVIGLKLAWKALQRARQRNGNGESGVAGLEAFTDQQIFFLAFGQVWCSNYSDEYLRDQAGLDEHSTGKPRIDGSAKDFDEFSKAFNCPADAPMNPTVKCNI